MRHFTCHAATWGFAAGAFSERAAAKLDMTLSEAGRKSVRETVRQRGSTTTTSDIMNVCILCLQHTMTFAKVPEDKAFRAFLGTLACLAVHPDCSCTSCCFTGSRCCNRHGHHVVIACSL